MRASRFKGNHHQNNSSMFSAGERLEAARLRAEGQIFKYKSADGKTQENSGPIACIGFFSEKDDGSVTHLDRRGVQYEIGGRIYETDERGVISTINSAWLRDQQMNQNDHRDHIFSLVETIMDIEDDDIVQQIFGAAIFEDLKQKKALPSMLSLLPEDSLAFSSGAAHLKAAIKRRNLAPDQLLTAGKPHAQSHAGAPITGDMQAMLGINTANV